MGNLRIFLVFSLCALGGCDQFLTLRPTGATSNASFSGRFSNVHLDINIDKNQRCWSDRGKGMTADDENVLKCSDGKTALVRLAPGSKMTSFFTDGKGQGTVKTSNKEYTFEYGR